MSLNVVERPLTPEEQDERYLHLVPELDARYQAGYDEIDLVYHVWGHGLNTFETTDKIRDELRERNVPNVPGKFVTHLDGKGHDYFLRKWFRLMLDIDKNPFSSAEQMHGIESGLMVAELGVDRFTIREHQFDVMGTKLGVRCNKPGPYSLCAGDMSNTGRDYTTVMKPDTEMLRREKENLFQTEVDPLQFMIGSFLVIGRYHYENLGNNKFLQYSPTMQELHDQRRKNLELMFAEITENIAHIGKAALKSQLSKAFDTVKEKLPALCQTTDSEPKDQVAS
jgi:hypothetical protein